LLSKCFKIWINAGKCLISGLEFLSALLKMADGKPMGKKLPAANDLPVD